MNKRVKKGILTCLLLSSSIALFATDFIPKKSKYYYELGGGSNINLPPPSRHRTINIGGYANADLGYTCTAFNPSVSIGNSLNNIKDSSQALTMDIVSSATAAVGSFPMYILAKASPELYNLLQNAMASANEIFKVSMKDCETALSDISKGKSIYEDWFSISDSQGWLDGFHSAKANQKVDINNVAKNNTKEHRNKGIPWIHSQNSGGKEQTQINVIQDIVIAGFNAIAAQGTFLTRTLDSNLPAPAGSDLLKFWKTPKEAAEFARYVLGDISISANKKEKDDTHAGMGLVGILKTCPFIKEKITRTRDYNDLTCMMEVEKSLAALVQSDERPSNNQLHDISAGSMLITPDIIQNIRNMDSDNKSITIAKLSEDIAMQNLAEQGLMLRRLLIAGSQTRPVQNLEPALTAVYKTLEQLDTELKNLSFEHDVRAKFSSSTIKTINNESTRLEQEALGNQVNQRSLDMNSGAVYTKGSKIL